MAFRFLEQGIDTTTSEGRLMYRMLAVIAEFQRDLIIARTREGLAAARARGRKGGRKPKLTGQQVQLVQQLYDAKRRERVWAAGPGPVAGSGERWVTCEIPGCGNVTRYSGRGAPPKAQLAEERQAVETQRRRAEAADHDATRAAGALEAAGHSREPGQPVRHVGRPSA